MGCFFGLLQPEIPDFTAAFLKNLVLFYNKKLLELVEVAKIVVMLAWIQSLLLLAYSVFPRVRIYL